MKTAMIAAAMFILAGCAGIPVNIDSSVPVGIERVATVGETFFERDIMTGEDNHFGSVFFGDAQRIELQVMTATEDKLILGYAEYTKPPAGPNGGYRKDEPWVKKVTFDKGVEYDLRESRQIPFRQYRFQILNCSGGKVRFTRTQ